MVARASVEAVPGAPPPGRMLVGRDAELTALRGLTVGLRSGVGGAALLVGEAGSGKSSLLAALLDDVGGALVVRVVGDELSQGFPLLPLVEAAAARGRPEIGRLMRGQGEMGVADSVVAGSEQLIAWFEDLCAASPVVLVFDDLHWADGASVRLWHRLTRSAEQVPLLVLGAMRPGYDHDELAALRKHLGGLQAGGRGVLLDLAPLASDAVEQLVAGLVGGRPGRRLVELAAAAGGNPFYATELVGSLQRSQALAAGRDGRVEATRGYEAAGSLAEVIAGRFDLVATPVRDVLRVAALLGVEFSVTDLAAASGRSITDLAGMVEEARAAGVLATHGAGMAFRHPLIRDVLYEQIAPAVRAAWHQEHAGPARRRHGVGGPAADRGDRVRRRAAGVGLVDRLAGGRGPGAGQPGGGGGHHPVRACL